MNYFDCNLLILKTVDFFRIWANVKNNLFGEFPLFHFICLIFGIEKITTNKFKEIKYNWVF